jgi:hypothetical protein
MFSYTTLSMLSGKKFRLERATLAIDIPAGKRTAVTVPSGACLRVISGPVDKSGLLHVAWDGKTVEMFEIDILERGVEIMDLSAGA